MFSLGLMSMRALQWLLVLGCIASIASAVNGVQSFSYDSATGSHTAYFAGWDRLWAVASALVCGIGAWGIYRRAPIVWPLGWVALLVSALWFVVEAAIMLLPQPYGWVGVIGAATGATLVVAYWGIWWQRHREYFTPGGPPAGWSPDLGPLRWFAVGMVAIALIFILAAVAMGIFHR